MILNKRSFSREEPSRDARSIYIFCEGIKREPHYFSYFERMDTRINLKIHRLNPNDNNSPLGLYQIACNAIKPTDENNERPQYLFQEGDEVWIVIDTDEDKLQSRKPQIETIRNECAKETGWYIVESNPCFEVWLYYHFNDSFVNHDDVNKGNYWKKLVNEFDNIGGFDSRKHPELIDVATENAKNNYKEESTDCPAVGSTQVYKLAESMLPIIFPKIQKARLEAGI